jgi:hypothetical protein
MIKHQLSKGECYKFTQIQIRISNVWTVAKSNNDKDFIDTDITEGFTKKLTSPKYAVSVRSPVAMSFRHGVPPKGGGANTYINRNELDQCINQLLFNKFVIKQYLFLQNGNIAQVHTNTHT